MTGQLESVHYFREGDIVQSLEGRLGTVMESRTHFAVVRWEDGDSEEIEQLDARVQVIERSGKE